MKINAKPPRPEAAATPKPTPTPADREPTAGDAMSARCAGRRRDARRPGEHGRSADVYRCGNAYTARRARDGKAVDVDDARTPAQRAEAREVARREKRLGDRHGARDRRSAKPRRAGARRLASARRAPRAGAGPAAKSSAEEDKKKAATRGARLRRRRRRSARSRASEPADRIGPRCAGPARRPSPRRLQPPVLRPQRLVRLDVRRIDRDALDRAHLHALRLVEVADALGAARRVDQVDLLAHRDRLRSGTRARRRRS